MPLVVGGVRRFSHFPHSEGFVVDFGLTLLHYIGYIGHFRQDMSRSKVGSQASLALLRRVQATSLARHLQGRATSRIESDQWMELGEKRPQKALGYVQKTMTQTLVRRKSVIVLCLTHLHHSTMICCSPIFICGQIIV